MVAHPQCLQDKGTGGLGAGHPCSFQTLRQGGFTTTVGRCNVSIASLWEDAVVLWTRPCSKLPGYHRLCAPLLALVPLLERLCCAYLLLSHLKVLLEIKDVDRVWHDGLDELLPADHDPARSKGTGCCYRVPDQQPPHCTKLVARGVALMESQLHGVCP